MPKIRLNEIICNTPNEDNKDEVFLKYKGKKIWPTKSMFVKMGVDDAIQIGVAGKFPSGWVEIELWDYDFARKNNHLGTFHLEVDGETGHMGTILSTNQEVSEVADYTLNWQAKGD